MKIKQNQSCFAANVKLATEKHPNNNIKIKQYSEVTFLDYIFDDILSGESMVIHAINRLNSKLSSSLENIDSLMFAYIAIFIDYAFNSWYPNVNKKIKNCPK